MILLISASQLTKITGMSHWHPSVLNFLFEVYSNSASVAITPFLSFPFSFPFLFSFFLPSFSFYTKD
jgi:hypothetical protein